MNILVISENIFDMVENNEQQFNGKNYKLLVDVNNNNWYYLKDEYVENFIDILKKFFNNFSIQIVFIHKGKNQQDLKLIENLSAHNNFSLQNVNVIGFHSTDENLVNALRTQDFNRVNEEINLKIRIPQVSDIKHEIANLLDPMRIDIDKLIETNFDDSFLNKIKDIYTDEKIDNLFKNVNELLNSISDESLKNKFVELFNLCIKDNRPNDKNVKEFLYHLSKQDKLKVKHIIDLHGNVYKKWLFGFLKSIEKLNYELK